jgi:hypothetical protein
MDHLIFSEKAQAIQELKIIFGLEALPDIRDFTNTIAFPRKYNLSLKSYLN